MVTGTIPTTACRYMCVKTRPQLFSKMRMAGQRVQSTMGSAQYNTMISQITAATVFEDMAEKTRLL